ncbi:MAG: hypothetical protein ABI652_05360 [Acidobacteriota bacterium]
MPSSPELARPKATVLGALVEGWRRVLAAPGIAAGMLLATLLVALPLSIVVGRSIESHLGDSIESGQLVAGWDAGWAAEFAAQAEGIARTFTYEILGFGGLLSTLSRLLDQKGPSGQTGIVDPALLGAIALYGALWVFLAGGLLDRFARGRAVGASAFFSACGVHFFRFLRLGLVIGFAYWALFRWLHPLLFTSLYDRLTRDLTVEHYALAIRALLYFVFMAALALVNVIADIAKVRIVVEDRRSALSALGAALRFIRRRAGRVIALYLVNVIALLIVGRLWMQVTPSAATPDWLAFLAAQAYLLARIWARLAFMASEVVFFQGELAHAQYTARPLVRWPDSPSVEGIRNLGA